MTGPRPGPGVFLTLEGPEGAGKSTQATRLADVLRGAGLDVVLTREPGGTRLGEGIRALLLDRRERDAAVVPWTDALLFSAARAALVTEVIAPALARGAVVVCDRFADSTLAYQGYGSGLPLADLRELERIATGGLRPDRTVLLDVAADAGLARKAGAETRFETDFDLAFHERVRAGFHSLAAAEPERFTIVDATAPADAVHAAIVEAVRDVDAIRAAIGPGNVAGEPDGPFARITR